MVQFSMRLAFYLDDGLICGGAEKIAVKLLEHWDNKGVTVYLVSRCPSHMDFYALPSGVQRVFLDASPKPVETGEHKRTSEIGNCLRRMLPFRGFIRLILEASRLRKVLRQINPDIAMAFLTPGNIKLLLSTLSLPCKIVASERNDTRNYKYPSMWIFLRYLLYRRADVVTANIKASIEDMARYVPKSKLIYTPNPIAPLPENAVANPADSCRILAVGRLVSYKRHLMLIHAFASLGPEFNHWELDIVGEGPMRPELEKAIAEYGLAHRVHLHGLSEDVDSYYRTGGIFVLPSSVEGTPNALLEAMAHGVPCIASGSISSARDYVEEGVTGFAFASNSVTDLARKIEDLARSPELRREMGRQARNRLLAAEPGTAYLIWDQVIGLAPASSPTPVSNA